MMTDGPIFQDREDAWTFDISLPGPNESKVGILNGGLFISHSSLDREIIEAFVIPVVEEIFGAGYFFYNAQRGGKLYASFVRRGLWSCASALVLISPDSLKSNWVRSEVRAAKDWGRDVAFAKILPCNPAELADSFLGRERSSRLIDISGDSRRAARRLRRGLFGLPPYLSGR
jgi:hypothetical protein